MKKVLSIVALCILLLTAPNSVARSEEPPGATPPLGQKLVREGDLAIALVERLQLQTSSDEVSAESALAAAGISPQNGWMADYPVTPIVLNEIRASLNQAAAAGKLSLNQSQASAAFSDVTSDLGLPIRTGDNSEGAVPPSGAAVYADQAALDNSYYDDGPPVITYYAPPWDYAYLYDWVACPFWYEDSFFPGFFVLGDFDIVVHDHHHHHNGHRGAWDGAQRITNHRIDGSGKMVKVDPATLGSRHLTVNRVSKGAGRELGLNAVNRRSAKSILDRASTARAVRAGDRFPSEAGFSGLGADKGFVEGRGATLERSEPRSARSFSMGQSREPSQSFRGDSGFTERMSGLHQTNQGAFHSSLGGFSQGGGFHGGGGFGGGGHGGGGRR